MNACHMDVRRFELTRNTNLVVQVVLGKQEIGTFTWAKLIVDYEKYDMIMMNQNMEPIFLGKQVQATQFLLPHNIFL